MLRIKRAAMAVGALSAAFAMLGQGTAQAAPISRTSTCAKFTGDYHYWGDGNGWYGFRLYGTLTWTCDRSGGATTEVTGDQVGGGTYDYWDPRIFDGKDSVTVDVYEPNGVKNIRIRLTSSVW